ncbi:unnamed protein product [Blepharisma stoltei]|uniref:Cyclin N-terminal domain-containing protein n=1 Tax=Blepharisma stoltei TaxID=1481888 RepID=A0AAU9JT61_9CILI|nr:unnamed protein product [Blepharisma stoltei]
MNLQLPNTSLGKGPLKPISKTIDSCTSYRSFGTNITNLSQPKFFVEEKTPESSLNTYTNETYSCMHCIEPHLIPQYGYMKSQLDINEKMRAMLIDWLVEVHLKFKLFPETLYLTINLIDRFLEKEPVKRQKLQLVGITAMFIACKYEESCPPLVKDFAHITDRAYSAEEILLMERMILRVLDFRITLPSPFRFVEIYSQDFDLSSQNVHLIRYLIELSFIEYKMIRYQPSLLAASAIYLSRKILQRGMELSFDTSPYKEDSLKLCAKDMCILLQGARRFPLQAVRKKYLHVNYCSVADIDMSRV